MLRLPVCLVCCLLAAGPVLAGDPATTGGRDLAGSLSAGGSPVVFGPAGADLLRPAPGTGLRAPDLIGLRPVRGAFDWRAGGASPGGASTPVPRAATFLLHDTFRF